MVADADLLIVFQRLGMALAIGFLVGVERGWKQRAEAEGARAAGLRTYTLIGLLGGVTGTTAAHLGPVFAAALALAFAGAFTAFMLRQAALEQSNDATPTMAGLVVFAIGVYAALGNVFAAAAAGVAATGVLAFKEALHAWLRSLDWKEIRSALVILAATFIALPLLPDRAVDAWGAINPRQLWILTILVATASFAGYVALRTLGPKAGLPVGAAAGALVSSTVVTVDLARRARAGEVSAPDAASAASVAQAVMLTRVGLLAAVLAGAAVHRIWPPLLAGGLVALAAALLLRRLGHDGAGSSYARLQSPLKLWSVARFALLLCALTVAAKIVATLYGGGGLIAFAATAGLVDTDAVTLAVAAQARAGLHPAAAAQAVLIGATANTLYKAAAGLALGGLGFGLRFLAVSVATVAAGAAAFALTASL